MKIMMALAGLDIGGAETHVVELSKELKRRGHDIILISGGGVYQEEIENFGIRHYTLPVKERNYKNIVKSIGMLKKIVQEEKPDILHSHARIPSFISGTVHRSLGKSFVYVTSAHGAFDTSFVVRTLSSWGEKTLAVSEDLKKYLIDNYGVNEHNIYMGINGIDSSKFNKNISPDKIIKEFGLNPKAKRIVYVSRLEDDVCAPCYGVLSCMDKIDKSVPGVEFIVVGGGTSFDKIRDMADGINQRLGRKAVILTGQRTDINEIHAAASVCLGVSRAILEPMSMGKPCVIAGQAGYIGILTEENLGVAIDSNFTCRGCAQIDNEVLTDDLIKLLAGDEKLIYENSQFGESVVKKYYSVEKMADDNEKMYVDAVRDHSHNAIMVGYYGYGNRGDDALLYAIVNDMREQDPGFSPVVLSKKPKETTSDYGVKSINRFNIFAVLRAMKSAKLLIAGGGSLIQDVTSTRSLMYYLGCLRTAKSKGLKVMLYANGLGPIIKKKNEKRSAAVLDRLDAITLRDKASYEYIKKLNITKPDIYLTGDPAFSLEISNSENAEKLLGKYGVGGKFFVVSARYFEANSLGFAKGFAAMIDYISKTQSITPVFVAMQYTKDRKITCDIISTMKSKAVFIDEDIAIDEILGIVSRSESVVAVRLHMLLFGAVMCKPILGLSYDPKVKNNISDMNLGSFMETEDVCNMNFHKKVDEFFQNSDELCRKIRENAKERKEKSKQNAVIASKLLK